MKLKTVVGLFLAVLMICFSFRCSASANKFIVADIEDRMPLPGTTVMSRNGTIVGFTDNNGSFSCDLGDMTLTLRCLGYRELTLKAYSDTVFMTPDTFELQEVVVDPVDKPVLKLRCYIREYTTGTYGNDTIQLFGEYMADYFLSEKKVKGFGPSKRTPYIRAKRLRARHKNAAGLDSIDRPDADEEFISWVDICSIDPFRHTVADSVVDGSVGVVMGKYGEFSSIRVNGSRLTYTRDILANHKNHHWSPWFFKMLGFTVDTSEMLSKEIYLLDDKRKYGPNTLQMATYTMEMTIKSKWVKKALRTKEPIKTYSTVEVYPVDAVYLTPQDAKDLEWDYSRKDITPSPLEPRLSQNIIEMLDADISN